MRIPAQRIDPATSAMADDTVLPFLFAAVQRKKVTAAFDGGRIDPAKPICNWSCNRYANSAGLSRISYSCRNWPLPRLPC